MVPAHSLRARREGALSAMVMPGIILCYHRIATDSRDPYSLCISPSEFRRQMEFVRTWFCPVALRELAQSGAQESSRPGLAVTFDDGYLDNLTEASPVLEELGLPATFFVTSAGLVEPHVYWWDVLARSPVPDKPKVHHTLVHADLNMRHQIMTELDLTPGCRPDETMPRPMSAEEIRTLASKANHEVGVHTTNHLFLPSQPSDVCTRELVDCKASLERLLNRPVSSVSYPFGGENEDIASVAKAAGFDIGVTVRHGVVKHDADPLRLPRIEVKAGMDLTMVLHGLVGTLDD
jgi:peptidoglycan/xylan/chitin deacetylase (PgdA/CDA1 family)